MTCDASTLLQNVSGFGGITVRPSDLAELSLLCSIYQGLTGMTCNVNTLMADAACFCSVTKNPFELIKLQLLCNINAAITGGSASGVTCGNGAPVAAPASGCGVYLDNLTGVQWNFYAGSWH